MLEILQQLDRLTQLRRHDQRLGLAKIETGAYRHAEDLSDRQRACDATD